MTARLAPAFAPANALRVWSDGLSIYVEVPGTPSSAILAYPFSEAGLSKALTLIRTTRYDFAGAIEVRPKPKSSAQAESILRQRGIIR